MHTFRAYRQRGRTRRVWVAVLCACAVGALLPLNGQAALSDPVPTGTVVSVTPGDLTCSLMLAAAAVADPTALFDAGSCGASQLQPDESWGV
ncbi:MAG: hypothetical protein ABR569_01920 [Gaiellaceae bacterium]